MSMRVIISPAKKMNSDTDSLGWTALPAFLEKTRQLLAALLAMDYEQLKQLWHCNDRIAALNYQRIQTMELTAGLTPAILAYEGIQYQYMAPGIFTYDEFDYIQERLRILSGFYGLLRPFDGVQPYRLEMQAKAEVAGHKDLYDFWGRRLYEEVRNDSGVMINLASREYSRCVEKYLTDRDTCITCTFGEMSGEKVITKGTYAKMARGEMVRFMAEHNVENPENMKAFDRLGYHFDDKLSSETEYVFIKE